MYARRSTYTRWWKNILTSSRQVNRRCRRSVFAIEVRIWTRLQSRQLHVEVARRVEQSGKFWFSTTELKGKAYFRISPLNFRTRTEHIDQLLALLEQECHTALESMRADKRQRI